ncbi:MAG TPA: prephenate dehydrogenase/arogenate dehydrogenase family protein [Planctomycetota bacterium]|nr:prephenate dehydrogenase/arogenate dehydrogenase family protein [Planctomycetota bacterium]
MSERFERVTIVGVGLIGGSLGLALCERGLCSRVVGVGHRQASMDRALETGAVHEATLDLAEGVKGADLVVLSTAVSLIGELGEKAVPYLKAGCIVSDVGSTKSEVVRRMESRLVGTGVHFVGAHPIAGSEKRGIDVARSDLFVGTVCVLTPTPATDADALRQLADLWSAVGARVSTLSPEEHDAVLARTSHLPHLAAVTLIHMLQGRDTAFVGTGLRDTTRVASGDVDIWCDIILTNREAILDAMGDFDSRLSGLRRVVEAGDREGLAALLAAARERRRDLWPDASPEP